MRMKARVFFEGFTLQLQVMDYPRNITGMLYLLQGPQEMGWQVMMQLLI